jgi:hypothetical protein
VRTMFKQVLAALLVVQVFWAAEAQRIETNWSGFQQQVTRRRLDNRKARISLTNGDTISAFFLNASDNGLIVRADRNTQQWATTSDKALLPRSIVSRVEFSGKVGRGGLIGGLAGLGAGAGAVAAAASAEEGTCEGSACGVVLLLIPALAVGGYLIGRATNKPAPLFNIRP